MSKNKREISFTSTSGLSAAAPPFNFNSKTHDQGSSFNYNFEHVYDFNYGCYIPCDDPFENEPSSYVFQCPSNSESYLLPSDTAASVACNSIFKLESLDSCGDAAVNKVNYSGSLSVVDVCADAAFIKGGNYSSFNPSAIVEPHVLQNAKGTMACHEKILVDKGKEKQNCETVINEAIDTLVMAKKDLSPGVPDDFNLESLDDDESFVPVQTSSVISDLNDSDVDSPCWKGTGFCQSAFRDHGPISSELPKTEGDSRKSLNPLAPHFFPGSAKPLVDYHGTKCEESDYSSFKEAASSVALSSKEHRLPDFVKAGTSSSEVSNAIETQFSNETPDAGKEFSLPKKLKSSSVPHSSFDGGPCLAFNSQGVTGANFSSFCKGIKPAILNGSTSVSFPPTENLLTSFFSGDGASAHFYETLLGAPKSTPPKIDVQLVINTMHDLSELLRWNCSNDFDSINEDEHDMIKRITDNLYVVQQRVSLSDSGHPCTSYCPVKLTDRHKEFQLMKMKPVTVSHDWEGQKSLPATFSKKVLMSSSSRSDEGIKIGDDVARQVANYWEKALKERQIVEEMHPDLC